MTAFSNYLENKLIDHIFRGATFAKPTTLAIALFTSDPKDDASGTEVSGGAYARVALNPSDTNWNATQGGTAGASSGSGGLADNAVQIVFPTPTASWGLVTHIGIFDTLTGGNLLLHAPIATAKTIDTGETPKIVAGDLDNIFN